MEKQIKVSDLAKNLSLKVLTGEESLDKQILLAEIHYPGIEVIGSADKISKEADNAIHVLDQRITDFISELGEKIIPDLNHYFSFKFPCLIAAKDIQIPDIMLEAAKAVGKPILRSSKNQSEFSHDLRTYLEQELGPETFSNNMTLMEVLGMGLIIVGPKHLRLNAVIELLRQKQRIISFNSVRMKYVSSDKVTCERIKHADKLIEIDKNKFINVDEYFGEGSSRKKKELDLIIKLENWNSKKDYDRLGIHKECVSILGVDIPKVTIPTGLYRSIGAVIQTAALARRLDMQGIRSTDTFIESLSSTIKTPFIKGVSLEEVKKKFGLELLNKVDIKNITIDNPKVTGPSVDIIHEYLSSHLLEKHKKYRSIWVVSDEELQYLSSIGNQRMESAKLAMIRPLKAIIYSTTQEIPQPILEIADDANIGIFRTKHKPSTLILDISKFLEDRLVKRLTLHGVMLDVFGIGIMITGKSGIGKSETALELIHRGHRLVSDDAVKFHSQDGYIVGEPCKIAHYMEIRGLGIIDIKTLYGLGSIRGYKNLDVIIELQEIKKEEVTEDTENYKESIEEVLGHKIKKINFNLVPGRNVASVIEILGLRVRDQILKDEREKEAND